MNASTSDIRCSAHPTARLRYLGCDARGFHMFRCPECRLPEGLLRWRSPSVEALQAGVLAKRPDDAGQDVSNAGGLAHTDEDGASGVPGSTMPNTESFPKGP